MRRLATGLFVPLVLGFVLGAGFLLGLAVGRAERGPTQSTDVLASLLQRVVPAGRPAAAASGPEMTEQMKLFWEAWAVLDRDFLDRSSLDTRRLTHGAIRGMIDAVGDPHTVFLDPVYSELTDAELRGGFEGIGIHVDTIDGRLQVTAAVEGTPGARAGLRAGDVLLQADGRDLAGLPLNDAVNLLRGPRGSVSRLLVLPEGRGEPRLVEITRAEIKLESVRTRVLDGGYGYVRLSTFASTTPRDLAGPLRRLVQSHAPGLVLDLRGNPGGFLSAALAVADEFVDEGVLLYQEDASGRRQSFNAKPGGWAAGVPVAVLIDGQSASAAEIVAGAIRDHGKGVLIGERTFGKGTVQHLHELSDKSTVRITIGRWLTPSEQPLQGVGLTPDIAVPSTADRDAPLERAVQYLQERQRAGQAVAAR